MQTISLTVEGMTCAACAKAVERVSNKLDGVTSANVNLASEKMTLHYDDAQISLETIQNAVQKAGYQLKLPSISKHYNIEGMTCAACAKAVERACRKLDGVIAADVNIATEKLAITYLPETVTSGDIKEAITHAGFKATDNLLDKDTDQADKVADMQKLWRRFALSALLEIPLFLIAMLPMIAALFGLTIPPAIDPMQHMQLSSLIQMILAIVVMVINYSYFKTGFRALLHFAPNMDSLVAIGTAAAFVYSLALTAQIWFWHGHAELYYESAGMILTLITLGKYMESKSKGRASEAIKKLMALAPDTARVVRGGQEVTIGIDEVVVGDQVIVRPGEKLPVDGVVSHGVTAIDESMLTGESMPAPKKPGDSVVGASINKNGMIRIEVTKTGKDTALSQIVRLVEEAQGSKAPIARLADIISGYFVPAVLVLAVLSGAAWFLSGQSIPFALTIFISVLVIACPCALGLATPTAIMVGTGKGAEYGILIKSGESLETAHKISTVVFDKTGTLTQGMPVVTDIKTTSGVNAQDMLRLAASAEKGSEHALGEAIVRRAQEEGIALPELEAFTAIPGHGIEAEIDGAKLLLGNKRLMQEQSILMHDLEEVSNSLALEGKTPMYIAVDDTLWGIIAVADTVKESSKETIGWLHKMGIQVVMITGDNQRTADAIGKTLGIDQVIAEVLPQDKAEHIKRLQSTGAVTAMVGDGINDAPALAQADVGIAIGSGTDVAMASADIVLMRDDIAGVATAIKLSKQTIRIIKQNLFWAFGYNTLGIPVAMGLLYLFGGPLLNPMIAALAMSLSSVSVVSNALRLRNFKAV